MPVPLQINVSSRQQEILTNLLVDDRIIISGIIQQIERKPGHWTSFHLARLNEEYKELGVLLEEVSGHPIND